MPRKTKSGSIASIVNGNLYFEDVRQCPVDDPRFAEIVGDGYTNSIRLVSLDSGWAQTVWLDWNTSVKETINLEMTLRREVRAHRGYWYAYRRVHGKLYKRFVGDDENVNQGALLKVARSMPSL